MFKKLFSLFQIRVIRNNSIYNTRIWLNKV